MKKGAAERKDRVEAHKRWIRKRIDAGELVNLHDRMFARAP
jgi:hypothetical protein